MSDNILTDVIGDIFTHLPVKSLLRFRSLSKPFRALIDSDRFIKSHLHNSLNSNSDTSIITICDDKPYSIDSFMFDKHNLLNLPGTQVIGCCNGLVCLFARPEGIFLCNPSTQKVRKLPVYKVYFYGDDFCLERYRNWNFGFGYDFVNDDYKLVRNAHYAYYYGESDFRVYSMKTNLWRKIKDIPTYFRFRGSGVFVDGKLHWVVTLELTLKNVKISNSELEKAIIASPHRCNIISFDLATEEFHLVPHPHHSVKNCWMEIGKLGEKLCAHCNVALSDTDIWMMNRYGIHCNEGLGHTDIWVMNQYGVEDSWTKLLSLTKRVDISQFESPKVVAYSKDEKQVLLEQGYGRFLWYDLKLKTVKRVRVPGGLWLFHPYICHKSLVKLTGVARTDVSDVTEEECQMRKKPKRDDFVSKDSS